MEKTLGIVFPGYGEQFIGMAKCLHDEHRLIQELFEQAAQCTDINFVKLMFASSTKEISSARNAFLAIFLHEFSLYSLLRENGLMKPDFIAGYGIGEYAAASASGSLSFADGLYILNKYSKLYSEFVKDEPHSVIRIVRGFDLKELQKICKQFSTENDKAYISAQNAEHAFYVSGSEKALDKIVDYCKEQKIRKVREIGPGHNLHSEAVDQLVKDLNMYFHKIKFKNLHVPIITCVDGVYVTTADSLQASIMRRINHPILWYDVMEGLAGCDVIISVGPGKQLVEWLRTMYPEKELHVVETFEDVENIREYLVQSDEGEVCDVDEDITVKVEKENALYDSDRVNEKSSDYDIEE
jgi:[acyl-carrier-protein] S-malonyltransferase